MKNENALIELFQDMFEGNVITFNPGWEENAQKVENFDDARDIQPKLKENRITVNPEADESTAGSASFIVTDPDGNILLFDQHRQIG